MEMTFERFMASLYMTAMLQLGLMQEERGQPRIDLLGARQTVDTLGLLAEKTKGNLTPAEENFLQNCLYELRMAYVEVTNALARPPQATGTNPCETMKATLTVLGSGTSMGVPTIGCECAVCRSSDPHDRRTRPSVLIEYGGRVVLIDTTPDFREQAIREAYPQSGCGALHPRPRRSYSWHRRSASLELIATSRAGCRSMLVPMWPSSSATCSATSSMRTTNSADCPRWN